MNVFKASTGEAFFGVAFTFVAVLSTGGANSSAQDLTHPMAMDLPAVSIERPAPEDLRLRLDNGMVAYIAEDHRAPLVSLTAYVGLGRGHGAPGESVAIAEAFRRGPQALPQGEFATRLAQMVAEYSVTLHNEETVIHLDVPAEDAWDAMALLADTLRAPTFTGDTVAAAASSSAAIDYNYSLKTAIDLFNNTLFAGHAFSTQRKAENTAAVADAAKALHASTVRTDRVVLAIAGDFDLGQAREHTTRVFASMPPANDASEAESFAPLAPFTKAQLRLKDAQRIQGWVVIGHALPPIGQEDEAALHVMDYILGAYHLDSRLYRASRELRGLTNDNSAFLEPGLRGPGSYTFRTYGRPEVVRLLIQLTFDNLKQIRDTRPTADELFVAKGALTDGLYAQRYATGTAATQSYAQEWLRYASHERSASYPDRVAAVTAADVQRVAQKYIHPERMLTTVVGPLDRIRNAVPREGEAPLDSWGETQ